MYEQAINTYFDDPAVERQLVTRCPGWCASAA